MHEGFYGGENSFVVRLSVPKSPNLCLSTVSSPELPSPYRSNGTTPQSRATAPSVSSPCCILPTSNLLTPSLSPTSHSEVSFPISRSASLPPSLPPLSPLRQCFNESDECTNSLSQWQDNVFADAKWIGCS